jgi:hypothetical protein
MQFRDCMKLNWDVQYWRRGGRADSGAAGELKLGRERKTRWAFDDAVRAESKG